MKTDLSFFAHSTVSGARFYNQRTGQFLFNRLPEGAANVVRGTLFDPFYKELTPDQIVQWLDEHVVFDDYGIIGIFNNNQILWERELVDA